MAQLNFGGVTETVVIRDEFPLEKASTPRNSTSAFTATACAPTATCR